MKRIFDIVLASVGTLICLPLMVLIAVAIRLDSPGEAIFRQRRAGWRGKPFIMLKFRTMRADVDSYGGSPHSADDPRLTRLGRYLRETSLDELPQLFNVLTGDMALVGPRPLYERQVRRWSQRQRRRLDVRPGITGFAQVYGRGALTHEDKIELDLEYVEKQSFVLNLKILVKTVTDMFRSRKATYEQRYSDHQEYETDQ